MSRPVCRLNMHGIASLVCAALAFHARLARADEPASTRTLASPAHAIEVRASARGLVVGTLTEGVALTLIAATLATQQDIGREHAALYAGHAGFVLAPLLAHGVEAEWARGAGFAALPLLAGAGMAALLAVRPDAATQAHHGADTWFEGAILLGLLSSSVGVFDSAFAPERRLGIAVLPELGVRRAGASIGGRW